MISIKMDMEEGNVSDWDSRDPYPSIGSVTDHFR